MCVILVRESENGRDVQNLGGSVRDERHEPRFVLPLLLQRYPSVCLPRATDRHVSETYWVFRGENGLAACLQSLKFR